MRILLLGCTGYIGSKLLDKLLEEGHFVTCISRSFVNISNINFKLIVSNDIFNEKIWNITLSNCDLVINCIGEIRNPKQMYEININYVKKIINLINNFSFKEIRLIHFSSVGVYNKTNLYDETKSIAEKLIQNSSINNNFKYTIIQPSNVIGLKNNNNLILYLKKIVKINICLYFGSKQNIYPFIHINDLLNSLNKIILNNNYKNKIVLITNQCTFKELYSALTDNKFKISVVVPYFFISKIFYLIKYFPSQIKYYNGIIALLSNTNYYLITDSNLVIYRGNIDIKNSINDEY